MIYLQHTSFRSIYSINSYFFSLFSKLFTEITFYFFRIMMEFDDLRNVKVSVNRATRLFERNFRHSVDFNSRQHRTDNWVPVTLCTQSEPSTNSFIIICFIVFLLQMSNAAWEIVVATRWQRLTTDKFIISIEWKCLRLTTNSSSRKNLN